MRQQGHQRHNSLPNRENSHRLLLLGLPSPTPISSSPEGTDDDEIPMLVAEAMEDFAPDNMLNKGNLDIPLKQESEAGVGHNLDLC